MSAVARPELRKRTTYAVWEITLKCNLACNHCGSRAGEARADELTTAEALDLIQQMAQAGINEVTLIGGEAYLRKDWLQLVKAIVQQGMICSMTTGGYGINAEAAKRMQEAGLTSVSVSIDGMQRTHDLQRGKLNSWKYAFESLDHLRNAGIPITANSQINRLSAPELPLLYEKLVQHGVCGWQLAMTVPMGNAVDNAYLLLQPSELLVLHPMLAYLAERGYREGLIMQPGNNVGYYGPYEKLLRSYGSASPWAFWRGCGAGLGVLGIEADGTIKGCPSLPTAAYTGGNIRQQSLYEIATQSAALTFNLAAGTAQGTEHLWGFCRECDYADLCRGGCSWTAHVFFDKRGNNPYCHHRALVQAAQGKRETLSLWRQASGLPFDNGVFVIEEEALDAAWPKDLKRFTPESIQWPAQWLELTPDLNAAIAAEVAANISMMQNYAASGQPDALTLGL